MKHRVHPVLSALLLASACSLPACASLIGSSVTGSLTFTGDPSNYFDPNNGFVPATGYLNTSSPTVTVSGNAIEFGYDDGANRILADLGAQQITITDAVELTGPANGFALQFTDAAFAAIPFTVLSGNLAPTGFSFAGNTLTLDYAGASVSSGETLTTVIGPSPVPEPSSFLLTFTSVAASALLFAVRGLRAGA